MPNSIVVALQSAVQGLLYSSESDESFEAFCWPDIKGRLTPESIRKQRGHDPLAPVNEVSFERFFSELTTMRDGSEEEKSEINRYRKLRETLEQCLSDLRVIRIGEITVAIYVVGKAADGCFYGIQTFATET